MIDHGPRDVLTLIIFFHGWFSAARWIEKLGQTWTVEKSSVWYVFGVKVSKIPVLFQISGLTFASTCSFENHIGIPRIGTRALFRVKGRKGKFVFIVIGIQKEPDAYLSQIIRTCLLYTSDAADE